jgi:hypothetical protein
MATPVGWEIVTALVLYGVVMATIVAAVLAAAATAREPGYLRRQEDDTPRT